MKLPNNFPKGVSLFPHQSMNMLYRNILNGRFNDLRYRERRKYGSLEISTMPLFCSYGLIGFIVHFHNRDGYIYDTWKYDQEKKEFI